MAIDLNKVESSDYAHASNLEAALILAINTQQEIEKQRGYTGDSSMLSGWKSNLKALRQGMSLRIKF